MRRPNKRELELISKATFLKTKDVGLRHAKGNLPYIKTTIADLRRGLAGKNGRPSIVVSAGPSLHKKKSLEAIKKHGFNGDIIAVDGSLAHCLRNGIVPDYVVTLDPHPHRIMRWFGDPKINERPKEDYFQRQDLDPVLNKDHIRKNKESMMLVNKYGKDIKVVISTSVCPEIPARCLEAGMKLFWWNPIYDDYDKPGSLTKKIYELTKAPCMVTGGNVGTAAWAFALAVLQSPDIILVGMDNAYPPGTNVINTQYYEFLKNIIPDDPAKGLIKVYNPYLKENWLTDAAYYWYNSVFLDMAAKSDAITYNCTEGGILFGRSVKFAGLAPTLKKVNAASRRK